MQKLALQIALFFGNFAYFVENMQKWTPFFVALSTSKIESFARTGFFFVVWIFHLIESASIILATIPLYATNNPFIPFKIFWVFEFIAQFALKFSLHRTTLTHLTNKVLINVFF